MRLRDTLRNPTFLTAVLLLSGFLSLVAPSVRLPGGLNLRAAQVGLGVALLGLVASGASWALRRPLPLVPPALLFWGTFLVWTIANSTDLGLGLGHCMLLGGNLASLYVAYLLWEKSRMRSFSALAIFPIGSLTVAVLSVFWLVAAAHGWATARDFIYEEQLASVVEQAIEGRPIDRLAFGVISSTYSAAVFPLSLALIVHREARERLLGLLGVVGGVVGIVTGVSRGAILTLAVSLITFVLLMSFQRQSRRLVGSIAVGLFAVVGVFGMTLWLGRAQPTVSAFLGRGVLLLDPGSYGTGTAGGRIDSWRLMLRDIVGNPLVGQGSDTFVKYLPPEHRASENFPLEILHASGLIGFLGYLCLVGGAIMRAVQTTIRAPMGINRKPIVSALVSACIGLAVGTATNPGAWGGLYWMLLGVLMAESALLESGIETVAADPQRG